MVYEQFEGIGNNPLGGGGCTQLGYQRKTNKIYQ